MDTRIEMRKKDFKKTFDDPRRRREEQQVQIRRQAREARLSSKRQQALAGLETGEAAGPAVEVSHIPELCRILCSPNKTEQFQACQQFRRLLSIERNPPIQQVINAGVVPRFVEFLTDDTHPELQFEAAWALTNIASGDQQQTRVVVDHGAVPLFVALLSSPKEDVREQAVWALGNIAGDCAELRDYVLAAGGLAPLLQQVTQALQTHKGGMMRNAAWTLSNLCRGKPRPDLDHVSSALPVLRELIYTTDTDVLTDSCWALSYLSDGNDSQSNNAIGVVLMSGVATRIVQLLCHTKWSVQTPALRTAGNIVSGSEQQTQAMVAVGVVPALRVLLHSPQRLIRKEACWTISNITAGNQEQIQEVIREEIIPQLITLSKTAEYDIQKEVYWALSNAASGASPQQVQYLVDEGIIRPLCDVLEHKNELRLVGAALEALDNVLAVGKTLQGDAQTNPYVVLVEEAGGFPKLEALQYVPDSTRVYNYAVKLMTKYMALESEDEESAAPYYDDFANTTAEGRFDFSSERNAAD